MNKLIVCNHASLPFGPFQTVRGLAFQNTSGEQIACYQLCRNGEAYAVADFRNGRVERFDAADSVLATARQWLAVLIRSNAMTV
jgi:hypothetical protein